MSREISEDFKNLSNFIDDYSLKELLDNKQFVSLISQQHKKYFSYLTCIAELNSLSKSSSSLIPQFPQNQLDFITESCSDIGSALFVSMHGAYKASRMMLRSSIETFLKGFNLDIIHDLDKEKSIYTLFDRIKSLSFFSSEPHKSLFDIIHNLYKLLCQDTHTATGVNMQHITALKYFPTFNLDSSSTITQITTKLIASYNTLICLRYNTYFHQMHYRNKENIIESVPKPFRKLIQGVE